MSIIIKEFTIDMIDDVVDFENRLRQEEDFWFWDIDEEYIRNVKNTFTDPAYANAITLLAYVDGKVAGRMDVSMVASRFDGTMKAYLDWICVIQSYRHRKVAQTLMEEMRARLKARGIQELVALTAGNDESQSFYRSVPNSDMHDIGIWIHIE